MRQDYLDYMPLSDEAFAELKKLCVEEYGDTLPDYEIRHMGSQLLRFFEILMSPEEERKKDDIQGNS
jgi:hypothetical protein